MTDKKDKYFSYVLNTNLKDCKNYLEKVNLRFAKAVIDLKSYGNTKYTLIIYYLCVFFAHISILSNLFYENLLDWINTMTGIIGIIFVGVMTLIGFLLSIFFWWAIIRSLFSKKE